MTELDTLVVNKQTFNTARIAFNDQKRAKKWMDVLIEKKVPHTSYIFIHNGQVCYAFKMFRIKKIIFELYVLVKEVFE